LSVPVPPAAALALTLALALLPAAGATARDRIRIVGSSTVFPYSQAVAELFGRLTGAPAPVVEATGTGGGIQIFCAGVGVRHPDIVGASRAMTRWEHDLCAAHGVTDITEALIGIDGLVIAVARANPFDWDLALPDLYLALAADVPAGGGWRANPFRRWSGVDPALPGAPIRVYGPPPTSGTRDAFVEVAMHAGCRALDFVRAGGFDDGWVRANCSRMRQDGPFIEAGENDNLIVQQLAADPEAMGIFGYSFLYENADRLKPVRIAGVAPDGATIAAGTYPIARPLFLYIKNAHRGVIPHLEEFVAEFMSEAALGPGGYLEERGMVPLPGGRRAAVQAAVLARAPMPPPAD